MSLILLFLIVSAYLFGSISSAILVCKIAGLPDPRDTGSHNPGATNVLRIGGKKPALYVLLGDAIKGFLPVLVARYVGLTETMQVLVLFSAFLGHLYPIFFRFVGGKGVATTIGGLLAFSWTLATEWGITWLAIALATRYSSLAALGASLLLPFYSWFLLHNESVTGIFSLLCLFILYRHKTNIKKLWLGEEKPIGRKN